MNKQKILIIEEKTIIALNINSILDMKDYEVYDFGKSAEEAINIYEKHNPDLILKDIIRDGGWDGIDTVSEMKRAYDIPKVYHTISS